MHISLAISKKVLLHKVYNHPYLSFTVKLTDAIVTTVNTLVRINVTLLCTRWSHSPVNHPGPCIISKPWSVSIINHYISLSWYQPVVVQKQQYAQTDRHIHVQCMYACTHAHTHTRLTQGYSDNWLHLLGCSNPDLSHHQPYPMSNCTHTQNYTLCYTINHNSVELILQMQVMLSHANYP